MIFLFLTEYSHNKYLQQQIKSLTKAYRTFYSTVNNRKSSEKLLQMLLKRLTVNRNYKICPGNEHCPLTTQVHRFETEAGQD
jgi:hypothetical protein